MKSRSVLQDGVAVGRRLRDLMRPGGAAGAGAVLDHHRMADRFLQPGGHDARKLVDRAARGERYHQPDRLRRIGLGAGGRRGATSGHDGSGCDDGGRNET
jgi:hypothetical protein